MSRILVVLLVTTMAASVAQAQKSNTREGFWVSFGLGAGSATMGGDLGHQGRETGLSGYLRMGGTISPKLLIGGESNGWAGGDNSSNGLGFLGAVAMFYPSAAGSFYLKGGLGLLTVGEGESSGLGASIGVGNEFRTGENFSVVLFLNAIQGFGLSTDGGSNLSPNWVQIGIGVAWH